MHQFLENGRRSVEKGVWEEGTGGKWRKGQWTKDGEEGQYTKARKRKTAREMEREDEIGKSSPLSLVLNPAMPVALSPLMKFIRQSAESLL